MHVDLYQHGFDASVTYLADDRPPEQGKIDARFTPGDTMVLSRALLRHIGNKRLRIRMRSPMLLCSEPMVGRANALLVGSEAPLNTPEAVATITWQVPYRARITSDKHFMTIATPAMARKSSDKASHTALYLLGMNGLHSRYVERRRYLPLNDQAAIDTHAQKLLLDGEPQSMPRSMVRFLAALMMSGSGSASVDEMCSALDTSVPVLRMLKSRTNQNLAAIPGIGLTIPTPRYYAREYTLQPVAPSQPL